MTPDAQAMAVLRNQVGGIALGSVFLFIGLAAAAIAGLHRRQNVRLVLWFGVFTGFYGLRMLAQSLAAFSVLPQSLSRIQ